MSCEFIQREILIRQFRWIYEKIKVYASLLMIKLLKKLTKTANNEELLRRGSVFLMNSCTWHAWLMQQTTCT